MPRTIGLLTALLSLCGADEAEDRWPLIFAAGEGDAAAVESLLAAGAPGMRRALPNSRVMIHQPSGGVSGQATDIEIHAREILATRER